MIKIRDLTFEYFDRDDEGNLTEMVNAIRGINFDAGEGEFIVVAGVNGSGKSTFAKILNRLLLPIEGTVLIGGLDAMQEENIIPIRKMVGMVFQNPDDQLIGSVVEEDVAFGAENISVAQGTGEAGGGCTCTGRACGIHAHRRAIRRWKTEGCDCRRACNEAAVYRA